MNPESSCSAGSSSGYGVRNALLFFCIAGRQRFLSGTPDLTRQPQAMSREQASADNALSSAVS